MLATFCSWADNNVYSVQWIHENLEGYLPINGRKSLPMSGYPILQPAKCSCKFCHVPASSFELNNVYNYIYVCNLLPSWHLHGKGFGWLKSWNIVYFSWGVLLPLRSDLAKPRRDKKDLCLFKQLQVKVRHILNEIFLSYLAIWCYLYDFLCGLLHIFLACLSCVLENDDSIFEESIVLF